MDNHPIVLERTYDAPIKKVWKALTDKNEMKEWYFDLADFRPEKGFRFQFYGGPPEKQYLHLCEVQESIPEKIISYSWKYDGYPGNSLVSFELSEEKNKTKLKLTHSDLNSFPKDVSDFDKKNFEQGWTDITESLDDYLQKVKTTG